MKSRMRFDSFTAISGSLPRFRRLRTCVHFVLCASAIVAISACGRSTEGAAASNPSTSANAGGSVSVTTAVSTEQEIPVVVHATGTFVADETFQVTPQVAGQVVATLVNVGDTVREGQTLFRLDSRDATLRLDQARASLKQAEAQALRTREDANRQTALHDQGLVARSEVDTLTTQAVVADAAVATARAQVAIAEKALDDTTVRTSLSGYISARSVSVGEYVTPSSRVATVISIRPIKLELQIPESQAMRLRVGMEVSAEVAAYDGVVFTGAVSAFNRAIDPASRAMTIEARFPNSDVRLNPGMFTRAQVRLPGAEKAVFVPSAALLTVVDGSSYGVYAIEDGAARLRIVQPGERKGDSVRIMSGLTAGAVVAVGKLDDLFDGAPVHLASEASAPAGPGSR